MLNISLPIAFAEFDIMAYFHYPSFILRFLNDIRLEQHQFFLPLALEVKMNRRHLSVIIALSLFLSGCTLFSAEENESTPLVCTYHHFMLQVPQGYEVTDHQSRYIRMARSSDENDDSQLILMTQGNTQDDFCVIRMAAVGLPNLDATRQILLQEENLEASVLEAEPLDGESQIDGAPVARNLLQLEQAKEHGDGRLYGEELHYLPESEDRSYSVMILTAAEGSLKSLRQEAFQILASIERE